MSRPKIFRILAVYREKILNTGDLDIYKFLSEFKGILSVERMACIREGSSAKKFNKIWKPRYEKL